jgi:hypothetical protein
MSVPTLPGEQAYLNLAGNQANAFPAYQTALNTVLSGQPAYNIDPSISANYFQNAILPGMRQQFANITLPGAEQSFAGPGYWGSARAQAEANAAANFGTAMTGMQANITYADELARRQALENAANRMAGAAPFAANFGMGATANAGEYARMIQQQQVMANYQRWLAGETVNGVTPTQYNPFLQLAFQYLGLAPFTYGQKSNQSSGGWNFGLLSSGNSGGAAAGALADFFA